VRNGRELAAWFRDRNAVLPTGSLIAHHVDSHDTFWWPLPGHKWRREQYGLAATRALLAIFALSGGAYMTFVGGEEGIEDEVRRVHRLRATLPEVGQGTANYDAVTIDHEAIYAVVRPAEMACTVVLVNMSDQPLETVCRLDTAQLGLGDPWVGDGQPPPRIRRLSAPCARYTACASLIYAWQAGLTWTAPWSWADLRQSRYYDGVAICRTVIARSCSHRPG